MKKSDNKYMVGDFTQIAYITGYKRDTVRKCLTGIGKEKRRNKIIEEVAERLVKCREELKKQYLTVIIVFLLCILFNYSPAQSFQDNQRQIVAYNVLFGGLNGAVGSMINKPKEEKLSKAFLRGFTRGCIGGVVMYAGKAVSYEIYNKSSQSNLYFDEQQQRVVYNKNFFDDSFYYGWLSKLIHTTGVSIVENAALHQRFMQQWTMDYGFIRFSITDSLKPSVRLNVLNLAGFVSAAKLGNLSLKKSLALGSPYFVEKGNEAMGADRNGFHSYGSVATSEATFGPIQETVAHENIHTLQNREMQVFSCHLKKIDNTLSKYKPYKIGKRLIYVDSYIIRPLLQSLYFGPNRYENYFEQEAYNLSIRRL